MLLAAYSSSKAMNQSFQFALAVMLTAMTVAHAAPSGDEDRSQHELLRKGSDLDADAADQLAKKVAADAQDLNSRVQLLGYYFRDRARSPDAAKAQADLVLWLIENHPRSPVNATPYAYIDQILNPAGYAAAKELWLKQTTMHKHDAVVLGNAAAFFLLPDSAVAEDLLTKAQNLEPESHEWSERLGSLYKQRMHGAIMRLRRDQRDGENAEKPAELAKKALKQFEHAKEQLKDSRDSRLLLEDLARVAFEAGDHKKAARYAQQLLKAGEQGPRSWNSGNIVHHGNLILGRLALRDGHIDEAKEYLLKAGRTTGSPQLNSFGPNMMLAQELLEKGEKQIVLDYFDLCAKFWDREELDQWASAVNEGETPDFGANLVY